MSKVFDTEAEMAVISLILKNPDKVYDLNDLKFFMFSTVATQVIWESIERIKEENLIPEPTLLFGKIEAEGKLSEAGGKDFLDTFLRGEYLIENLREYEKNIISNFKIKQILTVASDIQKQVKSSLPIDEVLSKLKEGITKLDTYSQGAETVSMLTATKDTWESIKESIDHPGVPGYSTGLNRLDLITYGFNPGKLWVIAGRPGTAKSASALNMALALGKANIPVLFLSKEMKTKELAIRMISTMSDVSITDIMLGNLDQPKVDAIQNVLTLLKNYPIQINDKFQPYDLTTAIRKEVSRRGTKVVFVDYLQLLSERGEDQTEELGRIVRSLKLLAGELDISIVILSQLNRLVELRPDKRPILSDIRQSGNTEEDVDLAVFLYRDELYDSKTKHPGTIEFIIRKNRMGPIGTLVFDFQAPSNKILDSEDM